MSKVLKRAVVDMLKAPFSFCFHCHSVQWHWYEMRYIFHTELWKIMEMTEQSANYSYHCINGRQIQCPLSTPLLKVKWECMNMMSIANIQHDSICSAVIMHEKAYTSRMGVFLVVWSGHKLSLCVLRQWSDVIITNSNSRVKTQNNKT